MIILISIACFSILFSGAFFILETRATNLPDDNKFKRWWRKHIVSSGPKEK